MHRTRNVELADWRVLLAYAASAVLLLGLSACSGGGAGKLEASAADTANRPRPGAAELASKLEAELARLGVDPKRALAAPGPGNAVFDLRATLVDPDDEGPLNPNAVRLVWTERLLGDYDQNGEVNSADLAPLGQNFGRSVSYLDPLSSNGLEWWPLGNPRDDGLAESAPPAAPAEGSGAQNWRLARIDGDFNGELGIGDITPIATHWRERLDGYRVYRKGPGDADFILLQNLNDIASQLTLERASAFPGGSADPARALVYTFETALGDPGEYEYYVAAWDGQSGQEGPPSVVVAPRLNNPPVAALTANPQTGNVPLTVSFDAGQSFDPDGAALTYSWDFDSSDTFIDIAVTSDADQQHVYSQARSFTARVTVTDEDGATAFAEKQVFAYSELQAQLDASPIGAIVPFMVELDPSGSQSSFGITNYEYDLEGDNSFELQFAAATPLQIPVSQVGEQIFRLRVTDAMGNQSTVSTTVTGYDKVHAALKSNLAEPIAGLAPLSLTLNASDSVGQGSLSYEWDTDGDGVFEGASAVPVYQASFPVAGTYHPAVRVTDSMGDQDTASLEVRALAPPIAAIAADVTSGVAPLTIHYSAAQSSDPDGGALSYEWDLIGSSTYETDSGTDPDVERTYTAAVTRSVRVAVTDSDGLTSFASVDIDVQDWSLTADYTISYTGVLAPMTVTFDASHCSADPGPITKYKWDFNADGFYDMYAQQPVVDYVFNGPGSYDIRLEIEDAQGHVRKAWRTKQFIVIDGVVLLLNDEGLYPANLNALRSDLDDLNVDYDEVTYSSANIAPYLAQPQRVFFWYRGGPGAGGEVSPDERPWTAAEMDDFLALLSGGARMMLLAQNVGFQDHSFDANINAWEALYGCTVISPAAGEYPPSGDPDPRRFTWASSLATDDGIGFGGSLGYFPSAPTSVIGSFGGQFGGDGSGAAERYGANGSGFVPTAFTFAANSQFSAIGFYDPWGSMVAGPNFAAGISPDPDANGYDLTFFSWGNRAAPDANIGQYPSYDHVQGPGSLWIVAYPWAGVSITASTPAGMTRADMLHNIIAWICR